MISTWVSDFRPAMRRSARWVLRDEWITELSGNLPNLAARLCAEAKGGQILTDQKTMSRLEDALSAEAIQELNLKGINRPVAAFNIIANK